MRWFYRDITLGLVGIGIGLAGGVGLADGLGLELGLGLGLGLGVGVGDGSDFSFTSIIIDVEALNRPSHTLNPTLYKFACV